MKRKRLDKVKKNKIKNQVQKTAEETVVVPAAESAEAEIIEKTSEVMEAEPAEAESSEEEKKAEAAEAPEEEKVAGSSEEENKAEEEEAAEAAEAEVPEEDVAEEEDAVEAVETKVTEEDEAAEEEEAVEAVETKVTEEDEAAEEEEAVEAVETEVPDEEKAAEPELSEEERNRLEEVYRRRFNRHFDELKWLYTEIYGNDSMFAELCDNLHRFYEERNSELKETDEKRESDPNWYKHNDMLGMMLYIDNFAGNIKGVEEKLDYLEKSNVNYIHLMPFLDTPKGRSDGGYAVSDFRKVQEKLGTMEDLESLTAACRKKNMNVCMDFVMNHTSEDHEWAKRARQGEGEYMSRYFFFDNDSIPQHALFQLCVLVEISDRYIRLPYNAAGIRHNLFCTNFNQCTFSSSILSHNSNMLTSIQ